ncbi:MAG TPA: hypothetical protein PK409_01270 [Thermosynergistes sp.]|nr:hypothetical protein [Thermosynergistes sp.]
MIPILYFMEGINAEALAVRQTDNDKQVVVMWLHEKSKSAQAVLLPLSVAKREVICFIF